MNIQIQRHLQSLSNELTGLSQQLHHSSLLIPSLTIVDDDDTTTTTTNTSASRSPPAISYRWHSRVSEMHVGGTIIEYDVESIVELTLVVPYSSSSSSMEKKEKNDQSSSSSYQSGHSLKLAIKDYCTTHSPDPSSALKQGFLLGGFNDPFQHLAMFAGVAGYEGYAMLSGQELRFFFSKPAIMFQQVGILVPID